MSNTEMRELEGALAQATLPKQYCIRCDAYVHV